ncbi:CBS domain-containing protein [Sungkyunkwania multivorans]|uniref:CBS domain-containing protein n=1 Tax=Sungkyunkwania multivorans TaxID=1173618 RepID=A0ABW3CYP0_9FLAO
MGIKSFQGPRAKDRKTPTKGTEQKVKVADHMTRKLITLGPNQTLLDVMEIYLKHKITGAPVVDEDGTLIGIISDSDCMKQISEGRYFNMPIADLTVEKFMTRDVETISGEATVFDAAARFFKTRHRRFPVVEGGRLVGQISRKDVMEAAMKLNGQDWH